jgi:DNA repair exonuclease SbcCD ATPase subunit
MNAKIVLPWILVLGLSAGLAAVYVKGTAKDAELAKLREDNNELPQLRTELAETKDQSKAQQDEIAASRKEKEELLRLRNEVGQLRGEKVQLSKQVQTAHSAAEQAQALAAQAAQTAQTRGQALATMQTELELKRKSAECVNNLRQLDAAKQQWALEHNKTAEAVPTVLDVAPYLAGNILPVCPAGGAYTLNAVNQLPTCSVTGHALTK